MAGLLLMTLAGGLWIAGLALCGHAATRGR